MHTTQRSVKGCTGPDSQPLLEYVSDGRQQEAFSRVVMVLQASSPVNPGSCAS